MLMLCYTLSLDASKLTWTGSNGLTDFTDILHPSQDVPQYLSVTSHKTGKVVVFEFSRIDRNEIDNETVGWEYASVSPDQGFKVYIVND